MNTDTEKSLATQTKEAKGAVAVARAEALCDLRPLR